MKINSIAIDNLRSHHHTEIKDLAEVVFFVGQNRVGKSTIIDAISYTLRGTCRGVDDGGRGVAYLPTRDGKVLAEQFRVSLATDMGLISRAGPGEGVRSPVQAQVDGLFNKDGGQPLDLRVLVETPRFLDFNPKDQLAWMHRVLTPRIPTGWVAQELGEDFAYLEPLRMDWSEPLSLDRAEKYVRERRHHLKKSIDEVKSIDLSTFPDTWKKLTPEEAASHLTRSEATLMDLREQLQRGTPDLKGLQAVCEQAAAAQGRAAARITELEADPAAARDVKVLRKNLKGVETKIALLQTQRAERLADTKALGAAQGELELWERAEIPHCPTCKRAYDENMRAERRAALTKAVSIGKAAERAVKDIEAELVTLQADAEKLRGPISDASNHPARLQKAKDEAGLARVHAEEASRIYETAKSEALDEETLAAVKARITRGDALVSHLRSYMSSRQAQEKIDRTLTVARAELASMERLVKKLSTDGIRNAIPGIGLPAFAAEFAQIAEQFGMRLELSLDPFVFTVDGRPTDLLSSSERLMVGLAFQVAAARVTGVRWIAFDDADRLDDAHRRVLHTVLAAKLVDQVIVCATLKMPDAQFQPKQIPPGWQFFLVQSTGAGTAVTQVGA